LIVICFENIDWLKTITSTFISTKIDGRRKYKLNFVNVRYVKRLICVYPKKKGLICVDRKKKTNLSKNIRDIFA